MTHHNITHRTSAVGAFLAAAALLAATAGPAVADPGIPGSTFPEQPGTRLQGGCEAILSNPNNAFFNRADPAEKITTGLTVDACFGG